MSKRLDELSQNLASGMTRRRALQIFAGGVIAAAFGRSVMGAEAASTPTTIIANFCKTICTPFFPGGSRGINANYHSNYGYGSYSNYYNNYTVNSSGGNATYQQCLNNCHACSQYTPNPCGNEICVQAVFATRRATYCLNA